MAELAEIKNLPRTFTTNERALYWQTLYGAFVDWYNIAGKRIFESQLENNQPRAARIYAVMSVTHYDAMIATWDGKYAYWAIRPFQLDPAVTTLFATPNHPSYPAAHGGFSGAIADALAYLFPQEAESIRAKAVEASNSRVWAGIHYRSDIETGLAVGRAAAQLVIGRVKQDGSE